MFKRWVCTKRQRVPTPLVVLTLAQDPVTYLTFMDQIWVRSTEMRLRDIIEVKAGNGFLSEYVAIKTVSQELTVAISTDSAKTLAQPIQDTVDVDEVKLDLAQQDIVVT
jgi:hypothetical protein